MEENSVKSRILDYVRAKGMSQKKFEQASGLSNGYLNSLRHAPSADKLSAILEAFPDLNRTCVQDAWPYKRGNDHETLWKDIGAGRYR